MRGHLLGSEPTGELHFDVGQDSVPDLGSEVKMLSLLLYPSSESVSILDF